MQWESLEGRTLFYAPVDTSRVFLGDVNDNPTTINRHMAQVFVVHGDDMDGSDMVDFAHAVQDQLPANQYQVLIVDWGDLAIPPTSPTDTSHHGSGNATINAEAVGDKIAGLLKSARAVTSRANLIGYSMGGTVIARMAKDLKTSATQVNSIIGIDPAAGRYEPPNYAQDSRYSVSFCGNDSVATNTASLSGDDVIELTNLSTNDMVRHQSVFTVVTTMWQRDAGVLSAGDDGVSSLFSLPSLLNGSPLPWRHNAFAGGFEALMPCGFQPTDSSDLGPLSVTYFNTRGHKITLS